VLDAAEDAYDYNYSEFHRCADRVAAALRAIVKQSTFADVAVNKTIEVVPVDILLAIANELEGND
jgi:hypothetical protein